MERNVYKDDKLVNTYARCRPNYPDHLFETIMDFYGRDKVHELAIDIGCGNGQQSTWPLAKYFRRVIGIDASAQQIAAAHLNRIERISFRVGVGEDLSFLDNNSIDLVSVAMTLHWLDHDAFYKEATRVLKPGAVLAAYGYGLPILENTEAKSKSDEFFYSIPRSYWSKHTEQCFSLYNDFKLPFPESKRYDGQELSIHTMMTLDDYINVLSTFSAWRLFSKDNPNSDLLDQTRARLLELYGTDTGNLSVTYPVIMLVGRKPN